MPGSGKKPGKIGLVNVLTDWVCAVVSNPEQSRPAKNKTKALHLTNATFPKKYLNFMIDDNKIGLIGLSYIVMIGLYLICKFIGRINSRINHTPIYTLSVKKTINEKNCAACSLKQIKEWQFFNRFVQRPAEILKKSKSTNPSVRDVP